MSKALMQSAAVAILCILTAASPALAKKHVRHHYRNWQSYDSYGSTNPYPNYTTAAAQPIIGRYTSQDFYPNPLVLNITGMDMSGNLSGSISGMLSKPQNAEDPAYQNWQHTFGRDARAVYRNNQVSVVFQNGTTYNLKLDGRQLTGQFVDGGTTRSISFMKSQIAPTAWGN